MGTKSIKAGLLAGLLILAGSAWGNSLPLGPNAVVKPNHPAKYTVKPGDNLWEVAELFVEEPWKAAQAWTRNPPTVYPGDQISLAETDGQKVLQIIKNRREVKLSPGARIPRGEREIEVIPIAAIQQFLTRPQVVAANELEQAPYIVANVDERLMASEGNKIYVRGLADGIEGDRFMVMRSGQAYVDSNNQPLAYEALYLGDARIEQSGDPAVLMITAAQQPIRVGDRLVPMEETLYEKDFYPSVPSLSVAGNIIAVLDGVSQIGQYQIVVLNKGGHEGVERGSVLAVYKGSQAIQDTIGGNGETVNLPGERAGTLLVFRVFDQISFALVMKAQRVINLYDEVDLP